MSDSERDSLLWHLVTHTDWSERWLLALAALYAALVTLVVAARRRWRVQLALLLALLAVSFGAEWLNELAARHWRLYAADQYFDSAGLFWLLVVGAPSLTLTTLITINLVCQALHMAAAVKRQQLQAAPAARKDQ